MGQKAFWNALRGDARGPPRSSRCQAALSVAFLRRLLELRIGLLRRLSTVVVRDFRCFQSPFLKRMLGGNLKKVWKDLYKGFHHQALRTVRGHRSSSMFKDDWPTDTSPPQGRDFANGPSLVSLWLLLGGEH